MLTLRRLTHFPSSSSYKVAGRAVYQRLFNSSNTLSKMSTSTPATNGDGPYKPRFVDIGINLTDPVFSGVHHGTKRHESDFDAILQRAKDVGCKELIITGSDLENSKSAIDICKEHDGFLYSTIGVHPCSTQDFDKFPGGPSALIAALRELIESSPKAFVAIGEIGLDYDRLTLSPKETQLEHFRSQLQMAASLPNTPPLFLHSRAAHEDFLKELKAHHDDLPRRGVVHSFTGTLEEMKELVEEGWDIGVNGCSLRAAESIEVVRQIPLDRLQIETDGPWCEMRPTHASAMYVKDDYESENGVAEDDAVAKEILATENEFKWVKKEKWAEGKLVKGRNEPCMIGRVAVTIARIKGITTQEVADAAYHNTVKMFRFREQL